MALDVGLLNVLVSLGLGNNAGAKLADDIGGAVGGAAEKATKSFSEKFTEGLSSAGKKASVAITAPLVALGTKGVLDAQKISAGLAEVVSLTGATGAAALTQIKDLSGEVGNLSSELGIAQETLVAGLYSAISAGVPRENVFEFLKVAGKAAIAGVTDTNTAVDGLTTVINAFGLNAGDAGKVADSLFTAVKGGKTTFQELSDSLFNVAPAAAAAGVDFQTVNAAIAALTSAGVPTSVATTQIRAALVGLQKPSKELDALFQGLGFETRAAAIESLGLQGALSAVKDAAKGDQGELQKLLGSVEAVGATNILAGTGAEKFTAELKAQAEAAGATDAAFDLIDTTRDFERLKVDLQNLSVTIGNVLLPFVKQLAGFAGDLAARFQKLSPETQGLIVKIGAFAAAIGPVLVITAKLITAVKTIVGVIKLLNLALLANPFVLIAAAAVVAVVLIIKNWDTVKAFFVALWEGIQVAARIVWDYLTAAAQVVAGAVTGAWNGVLAFFSAIWNGIIAGVKILFGFTGLGLLLRAATLVRENWSAIAEFFSGIFNKVAGVVRTVVGTITGAFSTAWTAIRNGVKAVYDFILGIFDKIGARIRGIADSIKNLPGSIVKGVGSAVRGLIPGFADGGIAPGGKAAIVGERGPELIVPRRTSTVIPNSSLAGLSSGGGANYQITIVNPVAEEASLTIPRALRRASYLKGADA
jgi:TP901 family phage tail tape measure protein